jgi:predicted RNA-binding protein Jag
MKCTRFSTSRIENRTNQISRISKKTSAPKTRSPARLRPTKSHARRFIHRFISRLTHVRSLTPSAGRLSRRGLFTAAAVAEESVRFVMPA